MKTAPVLPTIALVAIALTLTPTVSTADFVNGSFESGSYNFNGQNADSLAVGSTAITGWTTIGGELVVLQNGNPFGITTPYGNTFLDLTGYHDSVPYGGVEQSVATVVGQSYTVFLSLGVDNGSSAYSAPVSVMLNAGSASTVFTASPTGPANIWTTESFTFVADSSTTLVSIQGFSDPSGAYIGLDNLSIVNAGAVPEPSSIALVLVGLAGSVGYRVVRARRADGA